MQLKVQQSIKKNKPQTSTNLYIRPTPKNCYMCRKLVHYSNVYPKRRSLNLVEDFVNEEDEEVMENVSMIGKDMHKRAGNKPTA